MSLVAARSSLLAALLLPAAVASAQDIKQAGAPAAAPGNGAAPVADSALQAAAPAARDLRVRPPALLAKRDLAVLAGFTGGALALMPADGRIARWSRDPLRQENGAWSGAMDGVETAFEVGPLVVGGALWASGLVARNRTVADMGFHTLAVLGVNQQVTHVLKGAFGRSRPYVTEGADSEDWQWGSGFAGGTERRSFPSGHTSQAFAFATVMSHEIKRAWPRAAKVATPLLYAGAAGAGYARIYHDKHWASDVALGAAVGIVNAHVTLRFLHGRPGNWLDRLALNTRIVPNGQGGVVVATGMQTR